MELVACAEHRPTFPEFLGAGWHLPLDRILADFRHTPSKATLFLGTKMHPLRQTGWSGADEVQFESREIPRARFLPRENRWLIDHSDGLVSQFTASPKSAPRAWYRSEVRQGEVTRFRFVYHHGRCTQLLEMRDSHGNCARFEHAPLRGDHATLLLRAISIEGPKRTTLGRLQFSYVLHPISNGHEAVLHSLLLRANGTPPRNQNCSIDYFTPKSKKPRLLRSIRFNDRSGCLFVPAFQEQDGSSPHAQTHGFCPGQSGVRVWHEEQLTLVAEQVEGRNASSTRFALYSRNYPSLLKLRRLRHCRMDLTTAICRLSRNHVIIAAQNQRMPGRFEVLLWQWNSAAQAWVSYRRSVNATALELLEADAGGLRMQVVRDSDPHTCYELHWFDQPRAWTLTSMAPAKPFQPEPNRCPEPLSGAGDLQQEALFARCTLPANAADRELGGATREDHITWKPGELFSSLSVDQDLALIS